MTTSTNTETLGFQAEAKQLLHLMIHSLYSNRDIFLRELISNASDAIDKLRFEALKNDSLYEGDSELRVWIDVDKEAGTITISDNGIGMTKQEVIDHLGTIAKSGTAEFLQTLSGDQKRDSQLIGQFGVGFYSSFIVADKVEVFSRKAGQEAAAGVRWESQGESEFSVETLAKESRGTSVVLHVKKDAEDYLDSYRIRSIVKKYSDHISVPVQMLKQDAYPVGEEETDGKEKSGQVEYETVNAAVALWTRSRQDIKDEEYQEFYRHVSHDFQEPLTWSHNKVEGKLEYTSLLYIPGKAPYDLWHRDASRGLKLYVQRTFIMDDAEQFLPLYLRFIKGVVDTNNLSLNVSREILQKDPAVDSMRSALTKRALDMLEKMAQKEPEQYQKFWKEFGQVLKEGPSEDFANREKIARLLRFSTTHTDAATQDQSLTDYVARMKEGQDRIYYVVAENFNTARSSPHLEVFRKKGIEVLLMPDRIDEWLMSSLIEFEGKKFQDVAKGKLDLGGLDDEDEKQEQSKLAQENEDLVARARSALKDKVAEVRVTNRLTESPACLVVGEYDMGVQMRRIMEAAGQKLPEEKPIFELNPEHPLVKKLDREADEDRFGDLIAVLFDQAKLSTGGQLDDPASYVHRLNKLLMELSS